MDRKLQWAKMKGVICEGKLDCVWVINFNTSERQGKMHRWNLDVNAILLGHNYIYWDVWNGVLGLMQKMEGWLLSTAEMSHPLPGLSLTWECTLISLLSKNDQFSSFQKHCFLCVVKFYQRNILDCILNKSVEGRRCNQFSRFHFFSVSAIIHKLSRCSREENKLVSMQLQNTKYVLI